MARPMRFTWIMAAFLLAAPAAAENWPCFRGPSRQGISTESAPPLTWSATENVAWKTAIPGEGWSSPIVWDRRVFLTTATEDGVSARVLALDRDSGRVLWNTEVFRQELRRKERKNSFASSTPATDGQAVYAAFSDGGLAAVDMNGKLLWTYRDVRHYSQHGLGASPLLHNELVIMTYDGSSDGDNRQVGWKIPWDQALILALDKRTGRPRWRGRRGLSRIGHVTSNIHLAGGRAELVSGAGDAVQGFDLATGARLWSVYSKGEGVVPSIVLGEGLAFTSSGFEESTIRAVRLGGRGDVTATHIAWEQTRSVPRIPSFLYWQPYLYTITEAGIAMCLKAATGEIVWQERVGGEFSASPVYAAGHIYLLAENGETIVIMAGPAYEVVARNPLGEKCQASLAISNGRLFIRTEQNLYAIRRGR